MFLQLSVMASGSQANSAEGTTYQATSLSTEEQIKQEDINPTSLGQVSEGFDSCKAWKKRFLSLVFSWEARVPINSL